MADVIPEIMDQLDSLNQRVTKLEADDTQTTAEESTLNARVTTLEGEVPPHA